MLRFKGLAWLLGLYDQFVQVAQSGSQSESDRRSNYTYTKACMKAVHGNTTLIVTVTECTIFQLTLKRVLLGSSSPSQQLSYLSGLKDKSQTHI